MKEVKKGLENRKIEYKIRHTTIRRDGTSYDRPITPRYDELLPRYLQVLRDEGILCEPPNIPTSPGPTGRASFSQELNTAVENASRAVESLARRYGQEDLVPSLENQGESSGLDSSLANNTGADVENPEQLPT